MDPISLVKILFPESYMNMQQHGIMMYYNDWRNTGLTAEQYKRLLITRGWNLCNEFDELEETFEEQDLIAIESILQEKKENLKFISKSLNTKKFKKIEKSLVQLGTIPLKNGNNISLLNHKTTLCRFTKLVSSRDKILITTKSCLEKC